jgi:dihydrolipoamide dehydrogenase
LTEEEAKEIADIRVGRFPLTANPKASVLGETYGLIKIIVEKTLDQVLGVMIIGPSATELIGTACLGIHLEATAEELADTIFAHPTVSEIFREGAMTLGEGPIHLP